MKIHENVLHPKLLKKCIEELISLSTLKVWGISNAAWEENLQKDLVGTISTGNLSEEIALELNESLKKYFPQVEEMDRMFDRLSINPNNYYEMTFQYYIWNKMAGINTHNDGHVPVGATLYLNDIWHPNWGGLFVWKDKNEKKEYKLNAICPKQNMLIINDEKEMHLVTPTAPTIPYIRITIQMWYV